MSLPTTKAFREAVDHILKSRGIKVEETRTRRSQGRDYCIDIETYWSNRSNLRKVSYKIDPNTPIEEFDLALEDIKIWFGLTNQYKYIRIDRWPRSCYMKISAWCLIS